MIDRIVPTAAFICLALASVSRADDAPACGSFSLTGGEKGVQVVDNGPVGASTGDVRAGWRKLVDKDGKTVGEVHFVATVTDPGTVSHGDVLTSQYFIAFGKDWISAVSLYELPDASDTSQRAGDATLVVTGGTGTFSGASGTIVIQAGDPPTYVFKLTCGD